MMMRRKAGVMLAVLVAGVTLAACDPVTGVPGTGGIGATRSTTPRAAPPASSPPGTSTTVAPTSSSPSSTTTSAPAPTSTSAPATTSTSAPATTSTSTSAPAPTSAPTTTTTSTPPPAGTIPTAAAAFGWGEPIAAGSDEFNTRGAPDPAKWGVYGGAGHDGNGRRVAGNNAVIHDGTDTFLRQTGAANGDSAGMASRFEQKFGRWEVRARAAAVPGAVGNPYHPVLITWPNDTLYRWPAGAEYDFYETVIGRTDAEAFMHYPNHQPKRQEYAQKSPHDMTKWHTYGFEWQPGVLRGFLDGVPWFEFTGTVADAPGPMHQTIQLDNFFGSGMQAATFDVDFARVYAP